MDATDMKPLKKGSGLKYITNTTPEYVEAVEIAYKYFHRLGYHVTHGHAFTRKDNRVAAIANIYCQNKKNDTSLALVITFPKSKRRSTERVLEKLTVLKEFTTEVGVILVHTLTGTGVFPLVTQRIWLHHKLARLFQLSMEVEGKKKMREIKRFVVDE